MLALQKIEIYSRTGNNNDEVHRKPKIDSSALPVFVTKRIFAKVLKTLKYGQKCRLNLNYLKTGLPIIFSMQFGRKIKGEQHKTRQFREGY